MICNQILCGFCSDIKQKKAVWIQAFLLEQVYSVLDL